MKVTTNHSTALVSGNVKSVEMTLTAKGVKKATQMFRDKIYTHKAWAVVREILANAIDEQEKHKISKPVRVTLPTANDPCFRVRDYAKGLDEKGVFEVFFQYFASTKDQDNDSIGGFGIGAKSPLAYSEIFYVDSYHGGKKSSYIANIDGEVSTAHSMALEDTNETGIEVSVPVEPKDWGYFADLVRHFISFSKFQNFEFVGREIQPTEHKFIVEIPEAKVGNFSPLFVAKSKIYAQIKDILYPVDESNEFYSPFYQNVILNFENGEVEIAPSRERLDLSQATIYKIKTRLEEVSKKIGENYANELKQAKTAKDKFKIQNFSEIFRTRPTNLNAQIPAFLTVYKDGHSVIAWDSKNIVKQEKKSVFGYGYNTVEIDTEGKKKSHNWRSNGNLLDNGGSILLTGDNTIYSHKIIAFAEKHNLTAPVLCVKHDKVPNQWVEGVDIFIYDENKITEQEVKAVRDRYIVRLPTGQKLKQAKTKEDAILGYKGISIGHGDSITAGKVAGSNLTYILLPRSEMSKYADFGTLKQFVKEDERVITCFDSNLDNWNKFSKEPECPKFVHMDKFYDTLKARMLDYVENNNVTLKNGLDKKFSMLCKNETLKEKLALRDSYIQERIFAAHPEFKTQASKTSKWLDVQKNWDALNQEDRELARLHFDTRYYFDNLTTLKKRVDGIWSKVFC